MDVRCEKCQTEYELDEARLKPGGVTVKCTNCGHMFKIRKRSNTNVNAAAPPRSRTPSRGGGGPAHARPDSMLEEAPTRPMIGDDGPTMERQWLIRLENGEQKSCRELATLQQWIVANVVTRESLISRTGKTWKRLGDIAELAQYFDVADEARTTHERRASASKPPQSTMLGVGGSPTNAPMAAGGTILPDDDEQPTHRAPRASRPPTAPPPVPGGPGRGARRPTTQPPPPPPKKGSGASPLPQAPPARKKPSIPAGNRATAAWASNEIKGETGDSKGPGGPFVGKLAAIPDEPAFAGRVRAQPSSEASFDTDRVRVPRDDDDDVLPQRRGSSAGLWILLVVLIVGAGVTAGLYFFVFKKPEKVAKAPADAAVVATTPDAAASVTPIDAEVAPMTPAESTRHELAADNEERMQQAYDALAGKSEPENLALRAELGAAIAQALEDRADVTTDRSEANKLRKQAKSIVLEAATAAQKARKATPDDPVANLALAQVLRLQRKRAKEVRRYLDTAKANAGDWARDVAIAEALLLERDKKLDDAKAAFTAIDSGDNRLEVSNDVRARFHLALIALAQNRAADAKPLVDQVLAAQPDHAGAKALAAKLDTLVATTDPLPPEDPHAGSGSATKPPPEDHHTNHNTGGGGDTYDSYLRRANAVADTNCTKANELYGKALEIKPSGVEALTGQGYCALEAKNFATAHRKFSTALVTAPRYEPALAGIATAYTLQSRKDLAIVAWKHYLEAYPNAPKALKALDRLGAGSSSNGGGSGSAAPPAGSATPPANGGSATPPPTTPTPTPTPTPAPAGGDDGSDS